MQETENLEQTQQSEAAEQAAQGQEETALESAVASKEAVASQEVEVSQGVEAPQEPMQEKQVKTQRDNFRALVEKNRQIERERDAALRQVESYRSPKQQEEEVEEVLKLDDEDIVEGKHLSKIDRKYTKEIAKLRNELSSFKQASHAMSEEAILKAKYPDIDKVVTKENMDALRAIDEDFAEVIDTSTSFRAKAALAYRKIKESGLYNEDTYLSDRTLATKNAAKPRPLASVSPQQGNSPLSQANAFANGLTPELQVQLRKEMAEARKNR